MSASDRIREWERVQLLRWYERLRFGWKAEKEAYARYQELEAELEAKAEQRLIHEHPEEFATVLGNEEQTEGEWSADRRF